MKEQYVGDVSDYRKYALLRALTNGGLKLGVCWMLTAADGRTDGAKIGYLDEPSKWSAFDPELFDVLRATCGSDGHRSLMAIEGSDVLSEAIFFNRMLGDGLEERQRYFDDALRTFAGCDLVFFDPDNGLDVRSTPKGRKDSAKFVYRDEIEAFWQAGRSVLIYQHFTREVRASFVERLGRELSAVVPGASLWAFHTPHVLFLLAIQPDHRLLLEAFAKDAATRWRATFISGHKLSVAADADVA